MTHWNVINLICETLFAMDILVVFNTAYYETEVILVEDRKKIARNYIYDQFFLDFLALLPIDYILIGSNVDVNIDLISICRLFKMVRITRLFKVYNHVTDMTKSS